MCANHVRSGIGSEDADRRTGLRVRRHRHRGGPAGENAAKYAIKGTDLTAVIVERELVGGECSYYACMPSKALLRPIAVADLTGDLEGVSTAHVAPKALLARRDVWVSQYDDSGQVEWAEGAGIDVVRGAARLVGDRLVRVTGSGADRHLRARQAVVIATGSEANVPEMYAAALPWDSRDATGVVDVPDRLVIVGAGVVGARGSAPLRHDRAGLGPALGWASDDADCG